MRRRGILCRMRWKSEGRRGKEDKFGLRWTTPEWVREGGFLLPLDFLIQVSYSF